MNCSDRMCGANDCLLCHPEGYTEECRDCEGTGKLDISNCCGCKFNDDIMICSKCKDHCDFTECDECKGTGIDDWATITRREAFGEWQQTKAEEKRLEDSMYEPRDREEFINKHESNSDKENQ